jgi:hypothetical protein
MALVLAPTTVNTIECYTTAITVGGNAIIDMRTGTTAYIPAGNAITEIELQRRTVALVGPDAGQNISVGIVGNVATIAVASLNTANWVGFTNVSRLGVNVNTNLVVSSSAQDITTGILYVLVKYKPIGIGSRK